LQVQDNNTKTSVANEVPKAEFTNNKSALTADKAEIRRCFTRFCQPNEIYELRGLNTRRGTVSGYFDNITAMVDAAAKLSDYYQAPGVYFTLNPLRRDLFARAANALKEYVRTTANDADVLRRCVFPIDFDPVRPADISSSAQEHEAAKLRAQEARVFLTTCGWPDAVVVDSGNGWHLNFFVDEPNNDATRNLLKRCYEALAARFDDGAVTIDKAIFNAARIWKVYGSACRKGSNVPERPHRLSHVVYVPAERKLVSRAQLEALAALAPEPKPQPQRKRAGAYHPFELNCWMAEHGLDVTRDEPWSGGGRRLILGRCPFNSTHRGTSVAIIELASGALAFVCKHNECAGRGWRELRELLEPNYRQRQQQAAKQKKADTDQDDRWYPARAASEIHERFARDEGNALYVYRNGVYRPGAEKLIREGVKQIVPPKKWRQQLACDTVAYIRDDAPMLVLDAREMMERQVLNLANGLLNLKNNTLEPHSPELYTTLQLPVVYDPKAECPTWDLFVATAFPQDCVEAGTAYEILAYLMEPNTSLQKAILLKGPGGNGKSRYLKATVNFLGKANVSGESLQHLESHRFSTFRLVGKLANICADLPTGHLETSSQFKSITDGAEAISVEQKHRDRFDYVPFARLVFSSNYYPVSRDASEAFFDRWLVIPFERKFRGEQGEIPRDELDRLLAAELPGALNRALAVRERVRKYGITITESMKKAHEEFWRTTDPLAMWLTTNTVEGPEMRVKTDALMNAYNAWCLKDGRTQMSKAALGAELRRLRPYIQHKQARTMDRRDWYYVGIALKAFIDEEPVSHAFSDDDATINDEKPKIH
jgi:P4 family phage/plasmid primase-like protien